MYGLFPVTAGVSATTITSISPGAGRGKRGFFGMAAGAAALAGCGGGGDGGGGGGGGGASNRPPEVSDNPLSDLAVDAGADIVPINLGAAYFMDADGDDSALTFRTENLPDGLMLNEDGVITGRLEDPGEHEVTVVVTDADGNVFRHTFTVSAETPVVGQRRPTVEVDNLAADRVETVGEAIEGIDVTSGFGDPDGDGDLDFAVEFSRDGHGLTFDPTDNTITGTLTGTGDVTAIITVRNGAEVDDPSVEHRIVIEANERPMDSGSPIPDVINVTGGQMIAPIDLAGRFTDPDGDDSMLRFEVEFSTAEGHSLTFDSTANRITGQLEDGETTVSVLVTVTVTDGDGARHVKSFTVTTAAEGENLPPLATSEELRDLVLTVGSGVSLDVSGAFTDPDGEDADLEFGATGLTGTGLTINSDGVISGDVSGSAGGDAVTVTATDGNGGTASRTFGITVAAAGEPLQGSDAAELFIGGPGDDTIIGGGGDDAAVYGGASAGYSLVTGLSADGGFRVTVDDTAPMTDEDDGTDILTGIEEIRFSDRTIQVSDLIRVVGTEAQSEITLAVGGALTPIDLNTWFAAGGGGNLVFSVESNPPGAGSLFDGGDMISGSPAGSATLTVTATEAGVIGVSALHVLRIHVSLPESGDPLEDLTVDAGADIVPINLQAGYFRAPGGSALTFRAEGLPAGLMISDEGLITGRIADAGASTIRIVAIDSDMNEFSHSFTITAEVPVEGARRPTVSVEGLAADRVGTVGEEIQAINVARGFGDPEDDDDLTFAVAFSRADSGLTFNDADNTITGTFAGDGDVVVIVTATNGSGGREVEHRIVIEANAPPTASDTPLMDIVRATGGQPILPIDLAAHFTDPDGDDLEFAVTFSPEDGHGLMFDSSTNRITGQLAVGGEAAVGVTVTVTDGRGGGLEMPFIITTARVGENLPPLPTDAPFRDIVLRDGTDVSVDVSVAFLDPDRDALTFSAAVGGDELAAAGIGLSIDADSGVISGTFSGSANVDDVSVTAMDGNGGTFSRTFDIKVAAAGEPLLGGTDPELFVGGSGDDVITGGGGDDAAAYGGAIAGYSV